MDSFIYIQSSDRNTIFDVTMLKKEQTEKRLGNTKA